MLYKLDKEHTVQSLQVWGFLTAFGELGMTPNCQIDTAVEKADAILRYTRKVIPVERKQF